MRYSGFIFILVFTLNCFSQTNKTAPTFVPYRGYIDSIEEDQQITVFKEKGFNWKNCNQVYDKVTKKNRCKEAAGWPSRDAKIMVLGPPEKKWTVDPLTGDEIEETYVKIEFDYMRLGEDNKIHHQKGVGYTELYNLRRAAHNAFYGAQPAPTKAICIDPIDPNKSLKDIVKETKPLSKSIENLDVVSAAKVINQFAGKCPFIPATKMPSPLEAGNTYDNLILKQLKETKPLPIAKEDGKQMSQDDLINIDSIARTLYGEMGGCFRYGLHYPMAVAKVIVNRANMPQYRRTFIQPPHDPDKPNISKVATTLSQFSMWQKTKVATVREPAEQKKSSKKGRKKVAEGKVVRKKVPNEPLHQGLCPPRERGKPFYRAKEASQYENDVWTNALRIATEAILYPKKFAVRTAEITDAHYTSALSHLKGTPQLPSGASFINKMTLMHPTIEGRQIDNNKCLEIWKGQ